MDAPHEIDRTRLPVLARLHRDTMGAKRKIYDRHNDLCRERSALEHEIRTLQQQRREGQGVSSQQLAAKTAENEKLIAEITAKIKNMAGENEAAAEKSQAAGALYRNCCEFLGVDE